MIKYYLSNILKDYKVKFLLMIVVLVEALLILGGYTEWKTTIREHPNLYSALHYSVFNYYALTFLFVPSCLFFCVSQYKNFQNIPFVVRLGSRGQLFSEKLVVNGICVFLFSLIILVEWLISILLIDVGAFKNIEFLITIFWNQICFFLGLLLLSVLSNVLYECFRVRIVSFLVSYMIIVMDYIFNLKPDVKFNCITYKMIYLYGNYDKIIIPLRGLIYLCSLIIVITYVGVLVMRKREFLEKEESDENF